MRKKLAQIKLIKALKITIFKNLIELGIRPLFVSYHILYNLPQESKTYLKLQLIKNLYNATQNISSMF